MGVSEFSSRLKREDCKRTKHDSVFSEWKILIGPSDWEDHSLGKDGIERYRMHNLPISCSCAGLYELGIATTRTDLGRDVRKLDQDSIIAVYLGQADNVRTRLQHYGRAGSHLDNGNPVGYSLDIKSYCFQKGPGLFREIFSRGFPIVFRWAPMTNKREAEKTEAQLLDIFDYAWNKGGNGDRRPNDILQKLNKLTSSTIYFPNIARKLQQWIWDRHFGQKKEGISITASTPPLMDTQSSTCNDRESSHLRSRIFKFGRSQPHLVSDKCGVSDESNPICGVTLGDGSVCERTPVKGKQRCGEHNGLFSKSVTEGKLLVCGVRLENGSVCVEVPVHGRKRCELHKGRRVGTLRIIPERKVFKDENITVCGVALGDGSVCKNRPIEGRKRCGEHKGMRINWCIIKPVKEGESLVVACGVNLEDGSSCMEVPVHGRKRCELHKGRRVRS